MESKAKILGHPAHQILIPFPFGLLATSVIFDIVWLFTTTLPRTHIFALVAFWMVAAGIVGGLVASPFGLIDWLAIPKGTRAKSVGLLHGVGNLVVLVLFALSLWLRNTSPLPAHQPTTLALVLSFAGFALAGVTGWLGGELVDRLGVGVDDGAHLNAPNSLTHSSARGDAGGQVI
ncbi:MAG TPA: DUF2231 domain-containing protein [Pyrinomonadaceae bacterium]|nr:DUF2231 domain-containing protein [Pyrinomonadaceae bacterium]